MRTSIFPSKKSIISGLLTFAFLLLCAQLMKSIRTQEDAVSAEAPVEPSHESTSGEINGASSARDIIEITEIADETSQEPRLVTPNEFKQFEFNQEQWRKARGYFDDLDYLQYSTYSRQALYELMLSGDLLATHVLARMLKDEGQEKLYKEYLEYAAVQGSTRALIGLMHSAKSVIYESEATEQEKTDAIGNMLVVAELAAMRGDNSGISQGLFQLDKREMVLTEIDKEQITQMAEVLFENLKERRRLAGFDEFDNSIDPLERTVTNHIISGMPNPNNWGLQYFEQPEFVTVNTE